MVIIMTTTITNNRENLSALVLMALGYITLQSLKVL